METQTIAEFETSPKGIVEQLLDIAEKYDCMSEIGNATSWRWKEGIITRMPKIKTVAKILRAAYNTEDPHVWYRESSGDLKKYIKNSFELSYNNITYFEPKDIYEAMCFISISDGKGILFEELVNRLCVLKFSKGMDLNEDSQDYDFDYINKVHSKWAVRVAEDFLSNFGVSTNEEGYYSLGVDTTNSTESLVFFINEINSLQAKLLKFCSHFDMWRYITVSLTDQEMIELELELLSVYKRFMSKSNSMTSFEGRDKSQMRTRVFSFSAISLNNQPKEVLTWQN